MAEMCPKCGQEISKFEIKENCVEECPNCKQQYHVWCWGFVDKCSSCGAPNDNNELNKFREKQKIEQEEFERQRQEAGEMRLAEEQARQRAEQEKYQARINHLKATGRDGYYEYKVISLVDKRGAVDAEKLMAQLNDLGLDGWRLQCAYTNEMGKDSLSIAGFGINSTADQNILIFERFVKIE